MNCKLLLAVGMLLGPLLANAGSDSTAFTYQGQLSANSGPANGSYDFYFGLFDSAVATNQIGNFVTNLATTVTNGLFTATLDFGAGVFTGPARWLEVSVRTNETGNFTLLSPLQQVTPTPYAITADSASNLVGTLPTTQLTGALSAAQVTGAYPNAVAGSANTFSGALSGDVTGTQNATVVSSVGGHAAAAVAGVVTAVNGATSVDTPGALVERDGAGNFAAASISATFAGDGSALSNLNASELDSGTVPAAQLPSIVLTNGQRGVGFTGQTTVSNLTVMGTNFVNYFVVSNTPSFNGSKLSHLNPTNVSSGTAIISISGNAATATVAGSASAFSGSLNGDVTGTQSATVVSSVGGLTAATVAGAATIVYGAASDDAPGALVQRDGSGNFAAGNISGNFAGNGSALTNLSPNSIAALDQLTVYSNLVASNTLAATSTTPQNSPAFWLYGNGWTTASGSVPVGFAQENVIQNSVSAAPPKGSLNLYYTTNGGASSNLVSFTKMRSSGDAYQDGVTPPVAGVMGVTGPGPGDQIALSFYTYGADLFFSSTNHILEIDGVAPNGRINAVADFLPANNGNIFQVRNFNDTASVYINYINSQPTIGTENDVSTNTIPLAIVPTGNLTLGTSIVIAKNNVFISGLAFATNGFASYATNHPSMTPTGFTNGLAANNVEFFDFTGTSVTYSNSFDKYNVSLGTISSPQTIILPPGCSVTGASCAAAGSQGL